VVGGVMSILDALPNLQAHIPAEVSIVLLNVGGFGNNAVFATQFVWLVRRQSPNGGPSILTVAKEKKKYRPAVFISVLSVVAVVASIPFGIWDIKVHFIVSLLLLLKCLQ
jgi:hypothetical protein